jgi:cobalt/nickel transport system permease protein
MHIPDGFLDAKTVVATGLFSLSGLTTALRHAGKNLDSRKIPLIGLSAAFIFVAQMVNFPVAGGTSGHLVGATLAMVLLGPSAAIIVMSSVLIIQAFVFADGGVLALGANVLNMAIVSALSAYVVYRMMRTWFNDARGQLVSASVAAWLSTVVASIFCAAELALSGTAAWWVVFPAMAGVHALIGFGEAAITMLVLSAIGRTRPELLRGDGREQTGRGNRPLLIYGVIVVLAIAILAVPLASTLPDGLEHIARGLGFETRKTEMPTLTTPFKDYRFPGIQSPVAASVAAGLIGAAAAFAFSYVFARMLIPGSKGHSRTGKE